MSFCSWDCLPLSNMIQSSNSEASFFSSAPICTRNSLILVASVSTLWPNASSSCNFTISLSFLISTSSSSSCWIFASALRVERDDGVEDNADREERMLLSSAAFFSLPAVVPVEVDTESWDLLSFNREFAALLNFVKPSLWDLQREFSKWYFSTVGSSSFGIGLPKCGCCCIAPWGWCCCDICSLFLDTDAVEVVETVDTFLVLASTCEPVEESILCIDWTNWGVKTVLSLQTSKTREYFCLRCALVLSVAIISMTCDIILEYSSK